MKKLKDGWCKGTNYLKKIIISPSNGQYEYKENKYLICKSELSKDEFDELLFVRRAIEEFSIPSNIKIISSYSFHFSKIKSICIPSKVSKICNHAFSECRNLQIIEISEESKLKLFPLPAFKSSQQVIKKID